MTREVDRSTPLGAGDEFDMIRRLHERWGRLAPGLGDDAAILDLPRGERLVASTDASIENVHFRWDWLSMREVGYRAVTAALSDLAAMAAAPRGVLVALQLTPFAREHLMDLADGIGTAAEAAGTVIRGGNLSAGDALGITTTVLGSAYEPLRRSGARPGDFVYLTGALGAPAAAIRLLRAGREVGEKLRERFARPSARITESRWLASHGAIAAIDVSDGLAGDTGHLAAASGVAIDIQLERVPVVDGADDDDVFGGEEYELLVIARTPLPEAEFTRRFGIPLTRIGRVSEGAPGVSFSRAGKRVAAPAGYNHFSR